jgi:hypothetical protein
MTDMLLMKKEAADRVRCSVRTLDRSKDVK